MTNAIYAKEDLSVPTDRNLRPGLLGRAVEDARCYPRHPGAVAGVADFCPEPGELARLPEATVRAVQAELQRREARTRPLRRLAELRDACDVDGMLDELGGDGAWWRAMQTLMREQVVVAHKFGMLCQARAIGCVQQTLDRPSVEHTAQIVSVEMARNSQSAHRMLQSIERALRMLSHVDDLAAREEPPARALPPPVPVVRVLEGAKRGATPCTVSAGRAGSPDPAASRGREGLSAAGAGLGVAGTERDATASGADGAGRLIPDTAHSGDGAAPAVVGRENRNATPCTVSAGPAAGPDPEATHARDGAVPTGVAVGVDSGKRDATPCTVSAGDRPLSQSDRLGPADPGPMTGQSASSDEKGYARTATAGETRSTQDDDRRGLPVAVRDDVALTAGAGTSATDDDADDDDADAADAAASRPRARAAAGGIDWPDYPPNDDGTSSMPGLTEGQRNFRLFMERNDRERLSYASSFLPAGFIDDPASDPGLEARIRRYWAGRPGGDTVVWRAAAAAAVAAPTAGDGT